MICKPSINSGNECKEYESFCPKGKKSTNMAFLTKIKNQQMQDKLVFESAQAMLGLIKKPLGPFIEPDIYLSVMHRAVWSL